MRWDLDATPQLPANWHAIDHKANWGQLAHPDLATWSPARGGRPLVSYKNSLLDIAQWEWPVRKIKELDVFHTV